jgi:hypothetical protein
MKPQDKEKTLQGIRDWLTAVRELTAERQAMGASVFADPKALEEHLAFYRKDTDEWKTDDYLLHKHVIGFNKVEQLYGIQEKDTHTSQSLVDTAASTKKIINLFQTGFALSMQLTDNVISHTQDTDKLAELQKYKDSDTILHENTLRFLEEWRTYLTEVESKLHNLDRFNSRITKWQKEAIRIVREREEQKLDLFYDLQALDITLQPLQRAASAADFTTVFVGVLQLYETGLEKLAHTPDHVNDIPASMHEIVRLFDTGKQLMDEINTQIAKDHPDKAHEMSDATQQLNSIYVRFRAGVADRARIVQEIKDLKM